MPWNSTRNLTPIQTRNLSRNRTRNVAALLSCLALAAFVAGCRIHVDKDANGEEKDVQVDTPFGGVHVNTDQTTAADLGLPVYPGAELARSNDHDKSADVHMGFGNWALRVRVVSYTTPDSEDKVVAFYKSALGRYGDVIACQDNSPVGKPTATAEGLNCSDNDSTVNVNTDGHNYGYHKGNNGFELKAGSKRHEHIVGFESAAPGQTRFSLVALDLPFSSENNSGKSD
jgi:hypothetical protein